MNRLSRRSFVKKSLLGGAGLALLPGLLASRARAAAGSRPRLNIAQIGCGRMGSVDMENILAQPMARIVAVCDLDARRADLARQTVIKFYQQQGEANVEVKAYHDYREVLARRDVDAVIVSTPDHWHALVAVQAALAGKHLFVQKPITYDIAESIALRTVVRAKRIILQTGSQQRSEQPFFAFRRASELVRNGRVGRLRVIRIGVGIDQPSGRKPASMPVPATFDYDRWLGPVAAQPYMEGRVHPQDSILGRPGWITTEDFGLGMITNWGAHHLDIAQWAMGLELGGPVAIDARASFMQDDMWTVHHSYQVDLKYPNGVQVMLDDKFENGLRFEGDAGWIFCARGAGKVTASDPNAPAGPADQSAFRVSDPRMLAPLEPGETRWRPSGDHYLNWLDAIVAGHDPIAPVDQAVKSVQTCCAAWIGMKLGRPLRWDPAAESFPGDAQANALRGRPARSKEYDINIVMKNASRA
jgi:myo-inositol 2-dehydrogenase/D-chiro-inositol 1-dehydrogenase